MKNFGFFKEAEEADHRSIGEMYINKEKSELETTDDSNKENSDSQERS